MREVQPIFARHCLECHGAQRQKSGYRLDHRGIALRGGDSGEAAIVAGESGASGLLTWVSGPEGERMPPKGEALTADEVGVLRAWIDQGAPWPETASVRLDDPRDWWSLRPLEAQRVPGTEGGEVHPVDAFLRARLEPMGLRAAPEADRATLIRRVTFDLTGLPPSPEEVEAFENDRGARAYERLVDRLLASPRYGERWARTWLDVVHYGDTHGYDKDKPRPNAWPYRDYVIRSFNEDKPYARFVEEQIAGDVLYPDTASGIEALGFISAGPWDFIGHEELPETKTDGKIARHLDRDDMVSNTIGTFASMTVHCAQCHDHKFDPIPMEDYYGLQAVFAAVDRTERRYYGDPALNRQRAWNEARVRTLVGRERALVEEITRLGGEELKARDEAIRRAEQSAKEGQPAEYGYHSAVAAREDEVKWVQVDLGQSRVLESIVLAPARDAFNGIGDGFGFPRRYRVEVSEDPEFAQGVVVVLDRTGEDVVNPGIARQTLPVPSRAGRFVRVTATRLAPRQGDFIFALAELEAFDGARRNVARDAAVRALDSIEAPSRWAKQNLTDGKAPGVGVAATELARMRSEREAWVAERTPLSVRDELASTRRELAETRAELAGMPKPAVAYVGSVHHGSGNFRGTGMEGGRPRAISLLARGDVTKPGVEVGPGALRCVSGLPSKFAMSADATEGARRAALAAWLVAKENPLTWRSVVNRVWQQRFGRGIVETPNDFGRMGARPSHPELLDWLAIEFRDGGQSFKRLDRLLVTSAAYRQVSTDEASGTGARQDADNRWLWRMNRRRLEAEAVRDAVLSVSGVLDTTMYGPGFQDFVVEKPEHSPHYQYHLHDPEDPRSHRRSVYRFLVRSQQEPFMTALDCADPSMRVDRRNETLTPLQALALLNSRLVVSMAARFAARVEREAGPGVEARVIRAFALALQRKPTEAEREALSGHTERHGLASTCRLLMNLNEFVFVD